MQIADLVQTDEYDEEWKSCLSFIQNNCLTDPLYQNYITLSKKEFVSLPVVIIDNIIVAFSGAQVKDDWGPNIARISSRFWIHPAFRHNPSKFKNSNTPWYNSEFLIKIQLAEIRKLGVPNVFISREGNYRKSFQQFIKLVNEYNNVDFKVLEGQYLVQHVPQILALYSFDNTQLDKVIVEETFIKKL